MCINNLYTYKHTLMNLKSIIQILHHLKAIKKIPLIQQQINKNCKNFCSLVKNRMIPDLYRFPSTLKRYKTLKKI